MCPLVLLGLGMIEQVSEGMRPQKVAQRIWKPSRAVGIEFLLAMPIYAMMQNVVGRPAPHTALDAEDLTKHTKEQMYWQRHLSCRVMGNQPVAVQRGG